MMYIMFPVTHAVQQAAQNPWKLFQTKENIPWNYVSMQCVKRMH